MSKEGIPRTVLQNKLLMHDVVEGYRHPVTLENVELYGDVMDSIENGDGRVALQIALGMRDRFVLRANHVRTGVVLQNQADNGTGYMEVRRGFDVVKPMNYTRPLEEFYEHITLVDREAYSIAQAKGLAEEYHPIPHKDWPPGYWDYEADQCVSIALSKLPLFNDNDPRVAKIAREEYGRMVSLSRIYQNEASRLRKENAKLEVLPFQFKRKKDLSRSQWTSIKEWNDFQRTLPRVIYPKDEKR